MLTLPESTRTGLITDWEGPIQKLAAQAQILIKRIDHRDMIAFVTDSLPFISGRNYKISGYFKFCHETRFKRGFTYSSI